VEISEGIKVRGWLAPFAVEASKELIEIGYETGFGRSNAMGFGMVRDASQPGNERGREN
jgi:CRISPR-associated endoribonuclease Cas6